MLDEMDVKILRILQEDRRWVWVRGNHDPAIAAALWARTEGCLRGRA